MYISLLANAHKSLLLNVYKAMFIHLYTTNACIYITKCSYPIWLQLSRANLCTTQNTQEIEFVPLHASYYIRTILEPILLQLSLAPSYTAQKTQGIWCYTLIYYKQDSIYKHHIETQYCHRFHLHLYMLHAIF